MKIPQTQVSCRSLRQAFTLIEIVLVLAIISLLLGLSVVLMKNVWKDAAVQKAEADIKGLQTALVRYRTTSRMLPSSAQGLQALVTRPSSAPIPKKWTAKLEPEGIIDAWNAEYKYRNPGTKNPDGYDLFSMGPDGKEGTEDDIGNW